VVNTAEQLSSMTMTMTFLARAIAFAALVAMVAGNEIECTANGDESCSADQTTLLQAKVDIAAKTLTEGDKGRCDAWCDKDYCVGDWSEDCGGCSFCGAGPATPALPPTLAPTLVPTSAPTQAPTPAPTGHSAVAAVCRGNDKGAGCPPPGCTCQSWSPCSNWGNLAGYTPKGNSGECQVTTKDGCPAATQFGQSMYVDCKSDAQWKMASLYKGFGKFPHGSATTFKLPCLYPSTTFGDTPSFSVSPCMYPEVTDAYVDAEKQGVYASASKRVVKIHAYSFDSAGLNAATTHVFTKQRFENAIAKINELGMFKFLTFQATTYKAQKPTQAQWTKFTTDGFTSDDSSLKEAFLFFGIPLQRALPGEVQLLVFPKLDTLGLSSRSPDLPNSVFFRETGMASADLTEAADVMAHELGHAFGLHHTFNGLETSKLQAATCATCVPTASNGKTTGDGIADTPPTSSEFVESQFPKPTAGSYDYKACTMKIDSSAFCTTLPQGHGNMKNLMSYDAYSCRFNKDAYTPVQLARMRCFYEQDMSTAASAPAMPALGPAAISASGTVLLGWLPSVSELYCTGNACVSSYKVHRTEATGVASWAEIGSTTANERSFEDKTAAMGSTYKFRVVAVNKNGQTAAGNSITIAQ